MYPNTNELELLFSLKKQRRISAFFLSLVIMVVIFSLLFFFFFPISTYHTYYGMVEEEKVILPIPYEKLYSFSKSKIVMNRKERQYQITKIEEFGEELYITLELKLFPDEKIEHNVLEIISLERKDTLFQRLWK